MLVVAIVVSIGIFIITNVLGPRNPSAVKLSVYECGVKPEGNARTPFKNRFYRLPSLFLFDVEAAFFLPWALVYRNSIRTSGGALLAAMIAYLFFFVLGLVYIFRKNALELD